MTEDAVTPSLAEEMDAEAARRQAKRDEVDAELKANAEATAIAAAMDKDAEEEPTKEDMREVVETHIDKGAVEEPIDLDHTEQQRTAKIDLTEVADTLESAHGKPREASIGKDEEDKGCGLPENLLGREAIVAYITLHGITSKHRRAIEYTAVERNLWERYQRMVPMRAANKQFFVSALRLFKAGFPMSLTKHIDLNTLKVS